MGYYTTITNYPKIKKSKIEEARKVLGNTKVIKDYYDDMTIDENGNLEFEDWTRKFYDEEELAEALAPFTHEGRFELQGEDGDIWAIYFDGKGNWKFQDAKIEWVDW